MNTDMPISSIMTKKLVTVEPETTLARIKSLFEANAFHHLPVINTEKKLVGIISKEDFARAAYLMSLNTSGRTYSNLEYSALSAKDIMTTYPVFLEPNDTIGLAADIFLANKFHALPILEEGELQGLVTTHDLVRFAFSEVISSDPVATF